MPVAQHLGVRGDDGQRLRAGHGEALGAGQPLDRRRAVLAGVKRLVLVRHLDPEADPELAQDAGAAG
mgnify:CR=1 FL=1